MAQPPESSLSVEDLFDDIYEEHCEFVWRSLRRLGVTEVSLSDATQEVFLSAFRNRRSFEWRASIRTWLFAIARGVARDHRRALARHPTESLPDTVVDGAACPSVEAENREAARLVCALLEQLDEPKRAIFILAELEQLPLPQVAETLGINLNTAYSRLRRARQEFELGLARHRARERAATEKR